ncbi:MAG: 5-(carboxyamino)imidazole ribonucleotide mutase [Phycisphaerae bacterium]|nr:5-(carboxyamino)imidazole ribonucleotide mutase [Phycisphaerae bacterium]
MVEPKPLVAVVMGSDSDVETMRRCADQLATFGIACEMRVLSAHRTPQAAQEYAASAAQRGLKVIVAGAGMSAALAGAIAASTTLPVIGVPIPSGPLGGVDAAVSTLQMPPGVPVACMSIGPAGATNAALLAAEILALSDADLAQKLREFKQLQAQAVMQKDAALRGGK